MSAASLDACTEKFLVENCSVEVDFEVIDAIDKLQRLGLVTVNENNLYAAVSPRDAHKILYDEWCKAAPKARSKKHHRHSRTADDLSEVGTMSEKSAHRRRSHKKEKPSVLE
jgi:hypothetical protein